MQPRLKIAMVLGSSAMGGMEMRSARIARIFSQCGYHMHYGCPQGSKLFHELKPSSVNLFKYNAHGSLDIRSTIALAAHLKREKIDLLMAFSGSDYWVSIFAAKINRIPVILSRSTATPLNVLTAWFVRNADCILAVSQGIKTLLLEQGIPEYKIDLIYNGIDTDKFSTQNLPERDLLRKRFGMPVDQFIIGCLGRAEKGQTILLSLNEQLGNGGESVHYFFAGQNIPRLLGPFVHSRPRLKGRVTLRDMIVYDDMPAVLHALDVVVMLPETEPFSNAVIEAMAMEKPLVLSKTNGNLNAVEDRVSGFLVDINDSQAIVRTLTVLRDDSALARQMGKAARARAIDLFSQQTMLDNYERLYRRLIDQCPQKN